MTCPVTSTWLTCTCCEPFALLCGLEDGHDGDVHVMTVTATEEVREQQGRLWEVTGERVVHGYRIEWREVKPDGP